MDQCYRNWKQPGPVDLSNFDTKVHDLRRLSVLYLTTKLFFVHFCSSEQKYYGAVMVAQLVERLLPIPEVRGLNPVIGKKLY